MENAERRTGEVEKRFVVASSIRCGEFGSRRRAQSIRVTEVVNNG